MAHVNEGSHIVPAIHTFIHEWDESSCLYSTAAEHHRTCLNYVTLHYIIQIWLYQRQKVRGGEPSLRSKGRLAIY